MRIEIEKQIDPETRETWIFNTFDLNAVFIFWSREVKPKGKRKWAVESFWDKYGRSNWTMSDEPVLPQSIREEALLKVTQNLIVCTWDEWKKK